MEEWQRLNDGAEIEVTAVIVVCRLIRPRGGIPRPQVPHLFNVKQSGSVVRVCISRFLSWYSYVLVCLVCIEDLFGLRIMPRTCYGSECRALYVVSAYARNRAEP